MKKICYILILMSLLVCKQAYSIGAIDRNALIKRNCPHIESFDSLASLSVGNGSFAFTVDATGLQTFPEKYTKGIPLGTQSQWGWHSFENKNNFKFSETLKAFDFGRKGSEIYSIQAKDGRGKEAADWFRINPHRLHLGIIGFDNIDINRINHINQTLNLWEGVIESSFNLGKTSVMVQTACHPKKDMLVSKISSKARIPIKFRFAYPSGAHCDDGCDWNSNEKHSTIIVNKGQNKVTLKRIIGETTYYVMVQWKGKADFVEKEKNYFVLIPREDIIEFTSKFSETEGFASDENVMAESKKHWQDFWTKGAAVDFSLCKDARAKELERRVVLSQYLLAIQCAGDVPPQETGLTYNSWFGKFHMEMIWWHEAQFALWGHTEMLERTLNWYMKAEPKAKEIAKRQGFDGIRWMKMTDPSGNEAPSNVGSFLIWQQPHLIYLAELVYRSSNETKKKEFLKKYYKLIQETAEFMYSFATYDGLREGYILKGAIPAQETLKPETTINPPFELSYWHFGLETAQIWRERMGESRNLLWEEFIDKLSPLAYSDKLYLASEDATDTYKDIRFTSDHMAVLGALGILPECKLVRKDYMKNTLDWVYDNWNWGKTWGWDYPMTAMCAARIGEPRKAIDALLMKKRTNTYLKNGHNYQDQRLRLYLPGNGGLLTAVAMMCAGWDGNNKNNPGFPDDGNWNVRWEGLKPLP